MKKPLLLIVASFCFFTQFANAQAGAFDTSFGTNGIAAVPAGTLFDIALQPDGKIVGIGQLNVGPGPNNFVLTRSLSNGSPDTTFGSNGKATTLVGAKCAASAGVIQPDGKIIAVGYTSTTTDNFGNFDIIAIRYTATGAVDTTFGVDGVFSFPRDGGDGANAVELQADGKIVIAGDVGGKVIMIRLTPDGSLDTSFNQTGYVITNTTNYGEILAAKVLTDGSILAAGRNGNNAIILKYNTDGTLFSQFGSSGMVTVPGFTGITLIYNFAVLGNGDFVVAGGNRESVKYNGFMSKFNAAGELVTSFGTNGHFIQDGGGNIYNQAKDIVASNDKLIVGYGYGPATNYDYEVSRYDFNGVPDTDFGTNGNVIFNLGNASVHDYLHAVVLQPDGKIIAGGTGYTGGFTLVRLLQEVPELGLGAVILKDNSLTVYPNPVTANSKLQLTLKNDASITLNLYDVSGTLIKTLAQNTPIAAGTTNLDIKLPELSAGVYLLSVSGNGINQTVKIIK